MLRITTGQNRGTMEFRLEGDLSGDWVAALKGCWHDAMILDFPTSIRVDLTEVTFIDAEGKELLASMYRHGAEFVAVDVLTRGVIEEIEREHAAPVTNPI
jgi:hypothetical protein